jgi:hypothetical protein
MYASQYEKMKKTSGGLATYVWIGSGLFLFLSDGGIGALFSLKAILFFVVGMFVAAIVFGNMGYLLQRGLGKGIGKVRSAFQLCGSCNRNARCWPYAPKRHNCVSRGTFFL